MTLSLGKEGKEQSFDIAVVNPNIFGKLCNSEQYHQKVHMPTVSASYNPEWNCIVSTWVGSLDKSATIEFIDKLAELSETHDCKRVINDIRQAENKLSVTELFYLPGRVIQGKFDRTWKRAIVVKEFFDEALFYEDTATNQGLRVKIVTSIEEALAWFDED
ncbi:MAG: hypothetical protein H6603_02225 [Flavobacteriales bacterium]|nr:hypothetical protein [Flavobacteriales bacterium]